MQKNLTSNGGQVAFCPLAGEPFAGRCFEQSPGPKSRTDEDNKLRQGSFFNCWTHFFLGGGSDQTWCKNVWSFGGISPRNCLGWSYNEACSARWICWILGHLSEMRRFSSQIGASGATFFFCRNNLFRFIDSTRKPHASVICKGSILTFMIFHVVWNTIMYQELALFGSPWMFLFFLGEGGKRVVPGWQLALARRTKRKTAFWLRALNGRTHPDW